MKRAGVLLLVLVGGFFAVTGCQSIYILKLGMGQARIVLGRRPIASVLADPAVDPDVKSKLRLILEAEAFAVEELGLEAGSRYEYFYDTGGDPIVYTVTACPEDRLEAYTWNFPIVGEFTYKGFFHREGAVELAEELKEDGYDTAIGGAAAFSTLGWFSDPVFGSTLEADPPDVVETIIHEITHANIYVKGETPFNESIATWVGIVGAAAFLEQKFGSDSPEVEYARALVGEREAFSRVVSQLEVELEALFDEGRPRKEMLRRREEVYARAQRRVRESDAFTTGAFDFFPERSLNNAVVLALLHYHTRIDHFERLYREEEGDLRETLRRFQQDPGAILEGWRAAGVEDEERQDVGEGAVEEKVGE